MEPDLQARDLEPEEDLDVVEEEAEWADRVWDQTDNASARVVEQRLNIKLVSPVMICPVLNAAQE